jgi:hypothetical protein
MVTTWPVVTQIPFTKNSVTLQLKLAKNYALQIAESKCKALP